MGLCERAEGEQGEQERVDAFALGGCEGVLEVLQERCDRVFFYRVVSFECYHSGWNLLQAALFCTRPMYYYQGLGWGLCLNLTAKTLISVEVLRPYL